MVKAGVPLDAAMQAMKLAGLPGPDIELFAAAQKHHHQQQQ